MHAKKHPPHARLARPSRASEPDLSHLQTRKVDAVSSLAAEMMLRHADEDAALVSSQRPTPRAMRAAEPFAQTSPLEPSPSPPSLSSVRLAASPPARWTAPTAPERPEGRGRPARRVAILLIVGLVLIALSVAATFIVAS